MTPTRSAKFSPAPRGQAAGAAGSESWSVASVTTPSWMNPADTAACADTALAAAFHAERQLYNRLFDTP